MKSIFTLLSILLATTISFAQNLKKIDSSAHYRRQLSEVTRKYQMSMREDPEYRELMDNINRLRKTSDSYRGFILCLSIHSADFEKFNRDNALSGFDPLSGSLLAIGYGFSYKKNQRIFDFNISAAGLNKKTK